MKSPRIEDRQSFSLTLVGWTNYGMKRSGWHLKLIALYREIGNIRNRRIQELLYWREERADLQAMREAARSREKATTTRSKGKGNAKRAEGQSEAGFLKKRNHEH
jgi:hypothetical protein